MSIRLGSDPSGSGASSPSGAEIVRRTAGDYTLNNTAFTDVDGSGAIDLVLTDVEVGDVVTVGLSGRFNNAAVNCVLDAASIVSATPARYWSNNTATPATLGVLAWYAPASVFTMVGAPVPKTIVAEDLDGSTLTIRFRFKTLTAADKTLSASTTAPLVVWARNIG